MLLAVLRAPHNTRPAGTNCCYLEQLSNIPKYQQKFLPRTSDMVVNTVRESLINMQKNRDLRFHSGLGS